MKKVSLNLLIFCLMFFLLAVFLGLWWKYFKPASSSRTDKAESSSYFSAEKPNIVLITVDTLRTDHLQCYGYSKNISPNIDRLAEKGILFLNTMSQSASTPVSHASILTGLYPYHHGLRFLHGGQQHNLKDPVTTLAERLKGDGYRTAAFISAFPLNSRRYNLNQGYETYDEDFTIHKNTVDSPLGRLRGIFNTSKSQRRSDATNKKVFQWLDKHYREKFFIWVHYFDPHDSVLIPPEKFLQKYPEARNKDAKSIEMYDVNIAYTDYQFGELWKKIKKLGLDNSTFFILTSDHGQGLNDHNYWAHAKRLYQEQIHVPLIIKYSKLPQDKKISAVTRTVDIVPTILDALNLPSSGNQFDGTSLLPCIIENQPLDDLISYSETHYPKILEDASPLFSLIEKNWKFIFHSEAEEMSELFDLKNDPGETNNLAKKHPELIQKFKDYLQRENIFSLEAKILKPQSIEEDALEKLRSLGYLNSEGTDK
jgi:arylsulfatase A-like enzyme